MTTRYLAYIALLAGWICFCYWLYAEGISPRLYGPREKSWPAYSEDIPFPLVFNWASDVPLAGLGYGEYKTQFDDLDSTDEIVIISGLYFRDEAKTIRELQELGRRRISGLLDYHHISRDRMMTQVSVQEISADVRSNPFEAIRFERIPVADVLSMTDDTMEICFPLKDSLIFPQICTDRIVRWFNKASRNKESIVHVVGTADGSGIAEPADIALDRALIIKNIILNTGWKEENISLSTGQRNHPLTLRNRCVVVYFE
ncbi:MAG: hypothetical protein SH808_10550 [Saprospiraceae bacterium]|nr:hypothetical protein [Saprospiraceae bacterium]